MTAQLDLYRLLGRSGLRVSPLALGTMTFGVGQGWGMDEAEAARIVDAYAERGGNSIDTTNIYAQGESEAMLGRLLPVGDSLPFATDCSGVATLAYTLAIPSDKGEVGLGVTYVYTGTQRVAASSATPFDELEPFELLNLNLKWSNAFGSPLELALFATNVLDEEYATYHAGVYKALGFEVRTVGQPRMLGAPLKHRFGN